MNDLRCAQVREMLPAYLDEPRSDLTVRRHLAGCQDCKQELDRYEDLGRSLRFLSTVHPEPPADLLPALMAIPDADTAAVAVKSHVLRNRKAYLSGAAVLVAGAAGAALWRSKRRLVTA